ncbi:hypothetical protein I316_04514 [Kwoniella heveanensis BCC8398]|uniref:Fe2OG dioxygenase domain-containing protein n=1 Tax=Kwoniella heveanensis BCC8398 TaxID=1296120 RepID=A0A1B9GRW5_9TREE|nr:hypothetical protein I316_04514 [Kwoniella heveanensis BCC8398]
MPPYDHDDEDSDNSDYDDGFDSFGAPDDEVDSGSEGWTDDREAGEESGPLYDLGNALAQASGELGDFSFGGAADFLPAIPDVHVDGYGDITLPLVDSTQAEALIKVCEQAPFGRDHETLTDTSVRNSWQLEPSKLQINNPEWSAGLQKATKVIATRLGVSDVAITLDLYKLLLYKPGGHFAKHRDTEKADRMFATMVVQLPSRHQGGRLMVYKDSEENAVAHDFGHAAGTSPYTCHYAVHYADAEHAVEPITEGYRIALVYSICWPDHCPRPMPTAATSTHEAMARHLVELAESNRHFHYFLSHAYTPKSIAELGAAALKGTDRARMASLRSVNNTVDLANRYAYYLAKAEQTESWYGGGYDYGDCDWEWSGSSDSIVELYDLNGKPLNDAGSEKRLDDDDTLNPDRRTSAQLWRGHRTTTYEGYLGNEGPTKDTTYHKYVILALPLSSLWTDLATYVGEEAAFDAVKQSGVTPNAVRHFLQSLIKKASSNPESRYPHAYGYGSGAAYNFPNRPTEAPDNDHFRHSVFEEIIKLPSGPDRGALAQLYVLAFPACARLASRNKPDRKWADMLQLINNDDLWEAVRATIVNKLQTDFTHVHRFLLNCFSSGIPLTKWQDVLDVAIQPRTLLPSDAELASATTQEDTWKSSMYIHDAELCRVTVGQYILIDPSKLDAAFEVIADLYKHKNSRQFFTDEKRTILSPLLHRRIEYDIRTQREVAKAEAKGLWVFPDAIFTPRPEVQRFFRSNERTMTLYGLDGIGHARNFCNKHSKEGQNASYTLQPGGIGKNAFVEITKTQGQLNKRKKLSNTLKGELPHLKAIVDGTEGAAALQFEAPGPSSSGSKRKESGAQHAGDGASGQNDDGNDVVFLASKKARAG